MELIHLRLKEELDRLGLRPAGASKSVGEPDSQGLRDVLGGRKRLSADLLAALSGIGVDSSYVLTGQKSDMPLSADERTLIDRYRKSKPALRDAAMRVLFGEEPAATKQTREEPTKAKQTIKGKKHQITQSGSIINTKGG